jgi:hypothetical protein
MMDEAATKKNQMHNSEGNLSLRPDLMMDGARIIPYRLNTKSWWRL